MRQSTLALILFQVLALADDVCLQGTGECPEEHLGHSLIQVKRDKHRETRSSAVGSQTQRAESLKVKVANTEDGVPPAENAKKVIQVGGGEPKDSVPHAENAKKMIQVGGGESKDSVYRAEDAKKMTKAAGRKSKNRAPHDKHFKNVNGAKSKHIERAARVRTEVAKKGACEACLHAECTAELEQCADHNKCRDYEVCSGLASMLGYPCAGICFGGADTADHPYNMKDVCAECIHKECKAESEKCADHNKCKDYLDCQRLAQEECVTFCRGRGIEN